MDLIHFNIPKLFLKTDGDISENSDFHIWNDFGVTDGYCEDLGILEKRATKWIEEDSECLSIGQAISEMKPSKLQRSENNQYKDERFKNILLKVQ